MKLTKRITALLLTICIVIGLLPATVFAADNTIYILAGGDFQEAGEHMNSATNVTNILAKISQNYTTMDGFLFVGDYDCETHNDATETANGITALMGAVQGTYSNLTDANSILVQGNHDYKDSRIDVTGGHEFDGYSAYVLNEDDYPDGGGNQSSVKELAGELEVWLNTKIDENYDAPIFITSHLPLAFGPRTNNRGDGKYAKYIFDVLNAAGEAGLNIIFMHGHDHAYGADNYLGGEAIYLPKGDKINIAEVGSQTNWTEETLSFTYMNAGYVGYYNESGYNADETDDTKLTMTVFAITDNEVQVERYSANGLYNMKSAGRDGYYASTSSSASTLGLAYNATVYTSPQTIDLTADSAEEYGTIGVWVEVPGTITEDVTTSGGNRVTITEPVEATTTYTYEQAASIVAKNQYVIVGNNHAVALMDNNGSMGSQSVTISGNTMTSTTKLTEWTFSGNSSGTVGNGTKYLRYNNKKFSLGKSSNLIFANNGSNFRIYHKQSGYSFYYSGLSWTSSGSTPQYVRLYQWKSTDTTEAIDGLYGKIEEIEGDDFTYVVSPGTTQADALNQVKQGITIKYNTDGSDTYLDYPDDGDGMTWMLDPAYDGTIPGDYEVVISYNGKELGKAKVIVPAVSTYYIAEGDGLYTVDMDTAADDALAEVKRGVTVSRADDTNGTNKKTVDDSQVTWKWVDAYNGTNNGPYTVEILYGDTSLGTVEVEVDVQYDTELKDWTYIGESEATGDTYTYTLDTDGLDRGQEHRYIIVAENLPLALYATSTANSTSETVEISNDGRTLTCDTRDYEYYFVNTYGFTKNGNNGLYQENFYIRYGQKSQSYLDGVINNGDGTYCLWDNEGTARGLYYSTDDARFTVSNSGSYSDYAVRLYKYTSTASGMPTGPIYAKLEGNTTYTVNARTSATTALSTVKKGITGYLSSSDNGSGATELDDSSLVWKWLNTYKGEEGSYWVEISYKDEVLGIVEVKVEPEVVNNYPEYPNEGAIDVHKTATGVDFQASGIAQVELSASGVPVKKGADVIVMLDTSSSMAYCLDCTDTRHDSYECNQGGQTRAQALEESLGNLITQFNKRSEDGELLDIRVAIADFNGFYGDSHSKSGTPYDRDAEDIMSDDISYTADSAAKVYTGDGTLGAGAFVEASKLSASYNLNYSAGTNYDYAMDAIYQMGTAIKEENGAEDRDLFVIFMTDGAAMQWNYYHSQGASSLWNNWITGAWDANDLTATNINCITHKYYYDKVDHDGDGMVNEHRMANAIKGEPTKNYEVIRKTNTLGSATEEDNMYMVPGLGAKMFSIAFDPRVDNKVTVASMLKSVESIASEQTSTVQYYYNVDNAEALSQAFDEIGSEIAYAATRARFVDQMGGHFNLQMATSTYKVSNTTTKTLAPVIEVLTYDIYTRQDYLNGTIAMDEIGNRKGTYTLQEVVKFSEDGTKAYSNYIDVDKDGIYGVTVNADGTYSISDTDDNILDSNKVIYAKTFLYNAGIQPVAIEGVDIPTGVKKDGTTTGSSNRLPAETFYWLLGTVTTTEWALRYYVYLEGSMEGTAKEGSYATNEYATLYYQNYLDNDCKLDTTSPTVAWKSASVSFAFYLVNEDGEIIVNQTTGETGSFAHKIAVTNPVLYKTLLLNNTEQVSALSVEAMADDVLPSYYTLYDEGAVYSITINLDSTGKWEIQKGNVSENTTYVTQYKKNNPSAYSNALINNTAGDDYTHTVVWFAVVWTVQAHPDSVVVDYGLPVDISVLTNDMFGENGKLAGIGPYQEEQDSGIVGTALPRTFGPRYQGVYGTATADSNTGKVHYALNKDNGMQMQTYEKFSYAVYYSGERNSGYYYDTVTVIPATTVYYEEDYVTLESFTWQNGWKQKDTSLWSIAGETINGVQTEDRPGRYSLEDANNIYGYDSVNLNMSTYSMGSAMKATVDYDNMAQASFEFYGTGFDVISLASVDTGMIYVDVYDENDVKLQERCHLVDTYYGYKYENGEWIVDATVTDTMYQIPAIKIEGLEYGKYKAVIRAIWEPIYDHVEGSRTFDFYLDAIRIYDPTNNGNADGSDDTTIEDAYYMDGESWPSYMEVRDLLLEAKSFDGVANEVLPDDIKMEGLVFIDGDESVGNAQIEDYSKYGPNNEVYIAPGQRVAFILSTPENIKNVHVGIKSADGRAATYTITNIARYDSADGKVQAGDWYGAQTFSINTTTDMYRDLTDWRHDIIVISNTGNRYNTTGVISVTNIKSTYETEPQMTDGTTPELAYMYMTPRTAMLTLRALNTPNVEEVPEETTPVAPQPGVVTPDNIGSEGNTQEKVEESNTTVSTEVTSKTEEDASTKQETEVLVDGVTEEVEENESTSKSFGEVIKSIIEKIVNFIQKVFNWLFGWLVD